MIDADFLDILRCPLHPEGPQLEQRGPFLICQVDGGGFRVVGGIPHMLPEDKLPRETIERELAAEQKGTVNG